MDEDDITKFLMYNVLLFDYDGTLAKTMEYHFIAWKESLKHYNIKINKKDYFPLEGMNLNLIAKKLSINNKFSLKIIKDIVKNKKNIYSNIVKKDSYYSGVKKKFI